MVQLSVISWYGGKHSLTKQIVNLMPRHRVYVEVFGGSGVILLNKMRSKVEVYNDIHKGLASLFSVLTDKNKTKKLWEQLQLTLYSREEYSRACVNWKDTLNLLDFKRDLLDKDFKEGEINTEEYIKRIIEVSNSYDDIVVEVARMFYLMCRQSYAASLRSWVSDTGINGQSTTAYKSWVNYINKGFKDVVNRMRNVKIENLSFEDILDKYDGESTLFYLDPPYVIDARKNPGIKAYEYDMCNDMHRDLVEKLINLKGKFILSGYENDIYDALKTKDKFYKLRVGEKIVSSNNTGRGNKRDVAIEYLWTNFKPGEF